jgi:hypothetical protein
MSRIQLTDTPISAVAKLAEGNPGAAVALMALMKAAPIVDPDSAFGELSPLLSLDTYEIYGSDIYVLFNDCCDRRPELVLASLRAVQLGLYNKEYLKSAVKNKTVQDNFHRKTF